MCILNVHLSQRHVILNVHYSKNLWFSSHEFGQTSEKEKPNGAKCKQ